MEYVGFKVDKQGLHSLEERLAALKSTPSPKDVHQLRFFLGMVNNYNEFIMHSATMLKHFTDYGHRMQSGSGPKKRNGRSRRQTPPSTLVHFDPEKPIFLKCDASPYGVGASLCHRMLSDEE